MTVYEMAKKCMASEEFNFGGIDRNEKKWMDEVGFEYVMQYGTVKGYGEDAGKFFDAMATLLELNKKYSR